MMRRRTPGLEAAVQRFADLGSARVRDDRGYLLVQVPRAVVESDPSAVWNALVALLSYSAVDELHPAQQDVWWVLAYESAVQNGGHAAFLEQHPGAQAESTINAFRALGAGAHARVLADLVPRSAAATAGEASVEYFADLDAAFAAATPSLVDVLERHLRLHRADFVVAT